MLNYIYVGNGRKWLLTVRFYNGASNDLLSICSIALQCRTRVSEISEWQDCVCAVQHAGQAIINAIVVQFPVDFARAIARALTCYRDVLSRFDV